MPSDEWGLPGDADVYDVVLAFDKALEAAPNDHAQLGRWTARFPQFADDLAAVGYARFALGLTLTDAVEEYSMEEYQSEDLSTIAKPSLVSLTDEAGTRGLAPSELARRLRLDTPTLTRLNQRLLDIQTLPRSLVRQIAEILDCTVDDVAAYLRQPPRLAAGAQYKARQAPRIREAGARQVFDDALGRLPQADRDYWQSEIEKEGTLSDE